MAVEREDERASSLQSQATVRCGVLGMKHCWLTLAWQYRCVRDHQTHIVRRRRTVFKRDLCPHTCDLLEYHQHDVQPCDGNTALSDILGDAAQHEHGQTRARNSGLAEQVFVGEECWCISWAAFGQQNESALRSSVRKTGERFSIGVE